VVPERRSQRPAQTAGADYSCDVAVTSTNGERARLATNRRRYCWISGSSSASKAIPKHYGVNRVPNAERIAIGARRRAHHSRSFRLCQGSNGFKRELRENIRLPLSPREHLSRSRELLFLQHGVEHLFLLCNVRFQPLRIDERVRTALRQFRILLIEMVKGRVRSQKHITRN
jgi:hypothetical protein